MRCAEPQALDSVEYQANLVFPWVLPGWPKTDPSQREDKESVYDSSAFWLGETEKKNNNKVLLFVAGHIILS